MKRNFFYAPCPPGLENLLCEELKELGAKDVRPDGFGGRFTGDDEIGMRICIHSRLASRVLMLLAKGPGSDPESLYRTVYNINWKEHLTPDTTIAVHFTGRTDAIRNTQFGAVRVKDACADRMRKETGRRPSVKRKNPDLLIDVRIKKREAWVFLDLAGEPLHKRGYRQEGGQAPLRETLAAGILKRCSPDLFTSTPVENREKHGNREFAVIDPMCGSGTFLIEAACMAADIPPGQLRKSFGFLGWKKTDQAKARRLLEEAGEQKIRGLEKIRDSGIRFIGFDRDARILETAKRNAERAGVGSLLELNALPLDELQTKIASMNLPERGLVVTNPPYGERLGEESLSDLARTYRSLGEVLSGALAKYPAGVLIENENLGRELGIRGNKRYSLKNGQLKISLILFQPGNSRVRPFAQS